jgi:hypothetical protein
MAHDIALLKHTLAVLCLHDGRPSMEDTLASDIELRAGRPLTTDQVRVALHWLRDQGMAVTRLNSFDQPVWTVTEKGRSATIGM